MKALQWDCMTVAERYRVLALWDCEDFGGRARMVDCAWDELPAELRQVLRWTRA